MGTINNETNLTETATWETGVYEFQTTDPVQGGPDGLDNKPTRQLANRTQFLRAFCETLANTMAPLASPALTGKPTAPTADAGSHDEQLANTAFVQAAIAAAVSSAIASLVNNSPAALDTLNELAAAMGNDPNFATTITNALAAKAPLASPALTGTPTGPTAAAGTNTLQLATTAFVQAALSGKLTQAQADALYAALGHKHSDYAPLASPALTGTPTAPTATAGASNGQLANTEFVQTTVAAAVASAIASLVNNSPAALDTLKELATALGNDPNFATTITNALAAKAKLASPALTGVPTAPTAASGSNTAQVANTAFVQAALAKFGLGTNDLNDWVGDMNNLTTSGLWLVAGNTSAPRSDIWGWFVIVLPNAGGAYAAQLAMPQAVNELWFRAENNGTWSSWIKVAGTDSPAFTGIPTAPTAAGGTNNAQLATTAFVQAALSGRLTQAQADTLYAALNHGHSGYAPLASPALTGIPTGPTAGVGTNNTQLATTQFTENAIAARHNTDWGSYFCSYGWIIQVGRVNVANTGAFTTLTFPVAFPNRMVSFVGNLISPGVNVTSVLANGDAATRSNIPVAVFNVGGAGGGVTPIYYIAIGF